MSDKFEQCQCNTGEWQGGLCVICNGTGEVSLSSLQGEAVAYARGDDIDMNSYPDVPCAYPVKTKRVGDFAHPLFTYPPDSAAKIAELEAENSKLKLAIEFDNAGDDADWCPPHPIFQLAKERDDFMYRINELESELAEQARLLGISAERELALQAKLAEVEKDAIMWRSVSFHIEEAIRNGMCNFEIEDAYDAAIQESKKGGAV